jgi:SPW repeat
MWARCLEMLLGGWLVASPWVFGQAEGSKFDLISILPGCAVILLAAASFAPRTRRAHLAIGAVAIWLGATAYFDFERPGPPAAQNQITLALLLLTMFVIPNQASVPPEPWRGK